MDKISIFVTVGTNHYNFSRMLDLVDECLSIMPMSYELTLQYGFSKVTRDYKNCIIEKMLSRESAENAYANADLVFSHCGIGSIYNSLHYNRPTVIIPRLAKFEEFSDDHQLQIAREISKNTLVFMVEEVLEKNAFLNFLEEVLPQPKEEKDLTNHKLAEFIKSRLYS